MPRGEAEDVLGGLGLDVRPFDERAAWAAGVLRIGTRNAGLSLGDRACIALAKELGLPALTADKAWSRLATGVEVKLLR
jgi:PIN domain nuclease of toxin-antitoxin system